nr:phosphatase PAP2 family protein [Motilibacter deserti]
MFTVLTVASVRSGRLDALDWRVWNDRPERQWPELKPSARALTYLGLRAPTAAIALFFAWRLSRRARTWRPLVVLIGALLALNLVVGVLKIALGRAKAETGSGEYFAGGLMYPSGHSANAVVTWGVLAYLCVAYARASRRTAAVLAFLPTPAVAAGSWFLGSHWLTDLVAGWLIGAAVLIGAVECDRAARRRQRRAASRAAEPVAVRTSRRRLVVPQARDLDGLDDAPAALDVREDLVAPRRPSGEA